MRYQNVCLESLGYTLPEEVVSSEEIERRLAPLYQRLRLPEGRLELITGIRERRSWPARTRPGEKSAESGGRALVAAGVDPREVGCLIHASVCRDFLEPATACSVHHQLGLPPDCLVYDVSNACLGLLNAVVQVANMIELGQIKAGLIVGTEDSRPLLENTIAELNRDEKLTREQVKLAVASLTIGSGSAALLLTHREISRSKTQLEAGAAVAHTDHHALCQGGHSESAAGLSQLLMQTDSQRLMEEGLATGVATFHQFLRQAEWDVEDIQRTICHQVGGTHRKLMLESLGLSPERDFCTFPWLGNTGSVALPITLALAAENGFVQADDHVALLGIGSGINCLMLAVDWQNTAVAGNLPAPSESPSVPKPHLLARGETSLLAP